MIYISLNWQNICINYHGALPKIFDNFFKNISNIHAELDSLTTKNILCKRLYKFWKKSIFIEGGAALWKEIEQGLKILPYVTFCKHYKDHLLNYE